MHTFKLFTCTGGLHGVDKGVMCKLPTYIMYIIVYLIHNNPLK